jgi:hydrogenase nickel incorporation protein HypA/HybF
VHELSVCQALLAQVTEIAAAHAAQAVERITVEVGKLSGVEPALLLRAFEVARTGGCAAQAALSIKTIGITVSCLECGAESPARANRLLCAACGAYRTRVVGGDELRLRRVELCVSEPPAAVTA